jgi:hypothetical protein
MPPKLMRRCHTPLGLCNRSCCAGIAPHDLAPHRRNQRAAIHNTIAPGRKRPVNTWRPGGSYLNVSIRPVCMAISNCTTRTPGDWDWTFHASRSMQASTAPGCLCNRREVHPLGSPCNCFFSSGSWTFTSLLGGASICRTFRAPIRRPRRAVSVPPYCKEITGPGADLIPPAVNDMGMSPVPNPLGTMKLI